MSESLHSIFDIRASTPYTAGLPFDPLLPPPNSTRTTVAPQSALQRISAFFRPRSEFFRPRSIIPLSELPLKSNEIFGDTMQIPIAKTNTRFYFINLNGINLEKGGIQFRDLCKQIHKSQINIFAAAEHNLDTDKFEVRQILQNTARQSFTHYTMHTATSSTRADKFYKPGGTLLLAQGDIIGRIKERGNDPLGRWTWMKFIGREKRLITVISAYQVCKRPTHATGTTAFHQQASLLRQKGIVQPNPRKFFHRDLTEFIRLCKSRNELLILAGDFNEPITEQSSIARIAAKHQLVDIMFQRRPHCPEPNTYARGSTRIDYALISPELTDSVTASGYEPFHKRIKSDHRGFFIDFDTARLFGNDTPTLAPMALRDFTSKNPTNNTTYIKAKHAHLQQQQFFRSLAELQALPHGDHKKAEKLDKMLKQASEHASKKLKRFQPSWWSLKLTKARLTT